MEWSIFPGMKGESRNLTLAVEDLRYELSDYHSNRWGNQIHVSLKDNVMGYSSEDFSGIVFNSELSKCTELRYMKINCNDLGIVTSATLEYFVKQTT